MRRIVNMTTTPIRKSNYKISAPRFLYLGRFHYLGPLGILILIFGSCSSARTRGAMIPAPADRLTIEQFEALPIHEVHRFDKCRIEAGRDDVALARIARTRDDTEVVIRRTREGRRIELFAYTRDRNGTNANDWIRYIRTAGNTNIEVERGGSREVQIQQNIDLASRPASSFLIDFVGAGKIVEN